MIWGYHHFREPQYDEPLAFGEKHQTRRDILNTFHRPDAGANWPLQSHPIWDGEYAYQCLSILQGIVIPIPDAPCAAPCALTFAYICNTARSCREIPGNSGNHTEIECFSCLIFARSMTQPPFNGFISWESLLEPTSCASIKCKLNVQAASSPCTT